MVTGRNSLRAVLDNQQKRGDKMKDVLPEIVKVDPCSELKAELAELEATIARLNQEREDLMDDIQDIYSAWEEAHDDRYQLPF